MKEDVFFKIGYTTYLQKEKNEQKSWTSRIIQKIVKHKVITTIFSIIIMCMIINFWLIYKFINILEMGL